LHTGGFASGEISTKSVELDLAAFNASSIETMPTWEPSKPISLTSLALIEVLILCKGFLGLLFFLFIKDPPFFHYSKY